MKTFANKQNMTVHKKFRCTMANNLTPVELEERRKQEGVKCRVEDIKKRELNSTTYTEDKEMEEFLASVPSSYARFRLCENIKNPMPLPNFWPVLFNYRGILALNRVEAKIRAKEGWKTLAAILTDAYLYHGVDSITFKKEAFVETEEGEIYNVSDYRVPRSHCIVNTGAQMRLDQPRFVVNETQYTVNIALHPQFIALLPYPIYSKSQEQKQEETICEQEKDNFEVEDDFGIEDLFEDHTYSDSQDEIFSQEFSQVSLDDQCSSPVFKKQKLAFKPQCGAEKEEDNVIDETICPHCKVYKHKIKSMIEKHIRKSCPESPDIDALEASRRKKRANRKTCIKLEVIESAIKKDLPKEEQTHVTLPASGDCGCRGSQHLPECLRLRGGAGK